MPSLRRDVATPAPPGLPEEWRPQRFGHGYRNMKDPLVEPGWNGVRVIAHLAAGRAYFLDEDGEDCTAEFAEVASALAEAALADSLVLDGYLTVEPTQPTEGVAVARTEAPGGGPGKPYRIERGSRPYGFLSRGGP